MIGRLVLIVITIVLCTVHPSTGQRICGRLRRMRRLNQTDASITLAWSVHGACHSTVCYNITFGTIGGPLESQIFKWENGSQQRQITRVLENLIPEKEYMILITVSFNKTKILRRPMYVTSGQEPGNNVPNITFPNTTESNNPESNVTPKSKSNSNGGGIAGGVVAAFVFVVSVVIITLISVWLINRRRKQRDRNGLHYISVVYGIGNGSRKGRLHSRPGYLQIVHQSPCAGYEVPCNSVNTRPAVMPRSVRPGITLLPNDTEYPRREIRASADSNSSIDSVQMTTEPIQTASVGTDHVNNGQIMNSCQMIKNKKLVKPYAVVDVKGIETDKSLEAASHGVLDRLRAKRQKHEVPPSNREALKKSFGLCLDGSTTQVEQRSSGRYYTVPIYVNLNVPMTVNPSYNKNKV